MFCGEEPTEAGRDSADLPGMKPAEKTPPGGSGDNRMPYFLREYPRLLAHANFGIKNSLPALGTEFMARIAIVAIVIAGFFLTGDIAAVLRGGHRAVAAVASWPQQISGWRSSANGAEKGSAASPKPTPPSVAPQRSPPRIPAAATASARLSEMSPGDRLLVWCGGDGRSPTIELVAIDLIDPARGEALLSRHLDPAADLTQLPLVAGERPVRVLLEATVIERAGSVAYQVVPGLAVRPVGAGQGTLRRPSTGPVLAVMAVTRE